LRRELPVLPGVLGAPDFALGSLLRWSRLPRDKE
jgi:hypothetical protein